MTDPIPEPLCAMGLDTDGSIRCLTHGGPFPPTRRCLAALARQATPDHVVPNESPVEETDDTEATPASGGLDVRFVNASEPTDGGDTHAHHGTLVVSTPLGDPSCPHCRWLDDAARLTSEATS